MTTYPIRVPPRFVGRFIDDSQPPEGSPYGYYWVRKGSRHEDFIATTWEVAVWKYGMWSHTDGSSISRRVAVVGPRCVPPGEIPA